MDQATTTTLTTINMPLRKTTMARAFNRLGIVRITAYIPPDRLRPIHASVAVPKTVQTGQSSHSPRFLPSFASLPANQELIGVPG